jgi:hypothetical protein
MADYASMRALDVWYDKIDLQRYEDRAADPEVLARGTDGGVVTALLLHLLRRILGGEEVEADATVAAEAVVAIELVGHNVLMQRFLLFLELSRRVPLLLLVHL